MGYIIVNDKKNRNDKDGMRMNMRNAMRAKYGHKSGEGHDDEWNEGYECGYEDAMRDMGRIEEEKENKRYM